MNDSALLAPASTEQSADYVTNNLNQYTRVATDELSYDGNGNLSEFADDAFSFNTESDLVGFTRGSEIVEFKYDSLGRRTVFDDGTSESARLLHSGIGHIAEYNLTSGDLTKRHVPGVGMMLQPVADVDSNGDVIF